MENGKKAFTPEEIAKSLRVCATVGNSCADCIYDLRPDAGHCYLDLRKIAADMIEAQAFVIEKIAELAKLREENRWIPATEPNLPKEFVSVLVCIPSDDPLPTVKEAYLADGMWVTKAAYYTQQEVTHWRPMPKGMEVKNDAV